MFCKNDSDPADCILRKIGSDPFDCITHTKNAFLHLKRWRDIATRYAKNTASFLAAVHIRCIAIWANIL